jgi:hypothetical protein
LIRLRDGQVSSDEVRDSHRTLAPAKQDTV